HQTKEQRDIEAGRVEALDQGGHEWTVAALAIESDLPVLRGVGDQNPALWLDLGQSATDRARGNGTFHARDKGVVPAGIEDDEPQLFGALNRGQHTVQRYSFILHVLINLELRIDRNKIIDASHLNAVTGEIDNRPVSLLCLALKIAERRDHALAGKVT